MKYISVPQARGSDPVSSLLTTKIRLLVQSKEYEKCVVYIENKEYLTT